ncbi:MAG: hypothetical protein QOE53_423 [Pseudonocardiales bacterium]|nr:hypothetical protein [Pseudonocardiales bacterium]
MEDNSHAGQGPVVLDIGGDVGALIVRMPAELVGTEIEARPVAGPAFDGYAGGHLPHVAVLARPGGSVAVFGELQDGEYELNLRPDEPARLRVLVRGGEVSTAVWPASG